MTGGLDIAKAGAFIRPISEACKAARESEIVQAIDAGDKEKGESLATGTHRNHSKEIMPTMACPRAAASNVAVPT